jgi:hypothetical protein
MTTNHHVNRAAEALLMALDGDVEQAVLDAHGGPSGSDREALKGHIELGARLLRELAQATGREPAQVVADLS